MRTHVVVVCSVVGFLGLFIVILGVASEAATAQALVQGEISIDGKCVYQATPALACGIVAALLALTAQVAVTAASLFCGCCRTWEELPKETRRVVGITLAAVSWIIVIIVVVLFIAGAAMNTDQNRDHTADEKCPVDPGSALFAAATVFSLVATGLQIASYVLLLATPKVSTKPLATQQPELVMGQPKRDAEEVVAGGDPPVPPSAPPLSQDTEPTSHV
ncbi:unnamed protein product [Urochloa humidicola]